MFTELNLKTKVTVSMVRYLKLTEEVVISRSTTHHNREVDIGICGGIYLSKTNDNVNGKLNGEYLLWASFERPITNKTTGRKYFQN